MTAVRNTSAFIRTATVTVSSGAKYDATSRGYGQSAAASTLVVSPDPTSGVLALRAEAGQSDSQTFRLMSTGNSLPFTASVSTSNGVNWLSVTPASGTAPGSIGGGIGVALLTVTANAANLQPGQYTARLTISAPGAANSPIAASLTFTVSSPSPVISVTPTTLNFTYQPPGALPASQRINLAVTNSPPSSILYTASASTSSGGNWLSISPVSGAVPSSPAVSVSPSGLAAGVYHGTIAFTFSPSSGTTTVQVALTVLAAGSLVVTPPTLSFAAPLGSTRPLTQNLSITTASNAQLTYSVTATTSSGGSWLSVSPLSGSTPGSVSVIANPNGLALATYTGAVTITAPGSTAVTALITLVISRAPPPTLTGPPVVGFSLLTNSATPVTKLITINALGAANTQFTYSLTFADPQAAGWLSVVPSTLSTPAAFKLTASAADLAPGRYLAFMNVTPASGSVAAVKIPTVMNITSAAGGGSPLNLRPLCIWMSRDTPLPPPGSTTIEQEIQCTYTASSDPSAMDIVASANAPLRFSASLTYDPPDADWMSATVGGNALPRADQNASLPSATTNTSISVKVQPDRLGGNNQSAYISANVPNKEGDNLAVITAATGTVLNAAPGSLTFQFAPGATPSSATAMVTALGGDIPFTAQADAPWLSVSPASGRASPGAPVTLTASVNGPSLMFGTSGATISVQRTDDSTKPPASISVVANVTSAGGPVITQVVNGASFQPPNIAPATWVTIKGTNLANSSSNRTWRPDEIVGGKLPTGLDGVTVTINGKPAYVEYVSPIQLNVLAPRDMTQGPVDVIVNNNGQVSAPASAPLQPYAPAWFQYLPSRYAIAQRFPDNALIGNPDVIPGTVPAKPGDVITLWGTGFGPTNPAGADGFLPDGGASVAALPAVQLGGVDIPVIGAAISAFAADYQVSLRVPASAPDGDVPVTASVGGISSADGVFIYVKRP